jgi:hypothetical protein
MTRYTTHSCRSGTCNHRHATIQEAEACRLRHLAARPSSDRLVKVVREDGTLRLLTYHEVATLMKGLSNGTRSQ